MSDPQKLTPGFTDNLSNLISDIASDVNAELIQKAWFDNPITHDGRMSDYYQTPLESDVPRDTAPSDHSNEPSEPVAPQSGELEIDR